MKYDYLKDLPIKKRPKMLTTLSIGNKEYFGRFELLKWFIIASIPGLWSAIWNVIYLSRWMWAILGFLISEIFVYILFITICSGMSSSNLGTYFRSKEPIRFWLSVFIMVCSYILIITAIWLGK